MKYIMLSLLFIGSLRAQVFWKPINSAGQSSFFWSVAASPDQLIAVGTNGTIISSVDGTFWSGSSSGTVNWLVGVAYGNNTWVAVGDLGTILYADSTLHWSSATYAGTTSSVRLNGVSFGGGRFVAVGESGAIFTSPDGRTWTAQKSNVTGSLHGIAYGVFNGSQNYYIATGDLGVILYSTDGSTWSRSSMPVNSFLEAVVINNGTATIVGQGGVILQGTSPFSWSVRTSGTIAWLRGLSSDGLGDYVASGENGTILTSSNGTTWSIQPAGTPAVAVKNNLVGMTYSANLNHFFCVGDTGSIVASADPSVLTNVATRGLVGTDSNVLIAGFVVAGPTPKRVMVRAIGPSLSIFGLGGLLAQPVLTVYDSKNNVVAQNTGWSTNNTTATPSQINLAITLTGAFPIQTGTADSIVLKTLSTGAYTAQVSGVNSSTGTALVEVYQLP